MSILHGRSSGISVRFGIIVLECGVKLNRIRRVFPIVVYLRPVVVFWLPLLALITPMSPIYLYSGGIDYNGGILMTPVQCAGKCVTYIRTLAIRYSYRYAIRQTAAGYPAAAAVCFGENLRTNIHR